MSTIPPESASFRARGGAWVIGQSCLMVGVGVAGWLVRAEIPAAWGEVVGWLMVFWGALAGICGVAVLGTNRTIFPAPTERAEMVSHGIYRWIRHPLYSSLMGLSFGWSCLRWSWLAAVASVALTGFLWCKARREEAWLTERFPGYEQYQTRTKRFFPGLL